MKETLDRMNEQRAATIQARELMEKFEDAMRDAGIYLISKPTIREEYDATTLQQLKSTLDGICPESMLSHLKEGPQTFGMYIENYKVPDEYWFYSWRQRLMTEEEKMQRRVLREMGIE